MLIGILNPTTIFAGHLTGSKLFTGTQDLVTDATNACSTLIAVVAVVAVIYFQIRKAISDEMDHKKWDTRTTVGVVAFVIGISAKVIIEIFNNFYA